MSCLYNHLVTLQIHCVSSQRVFFANKQSQIKCFHLFMMLKVEICRLGNRMRLR